MFVITLRELATVFHARSAGNCAPHPAQAMYYFLSGYTAKIAGTELGVKEPQPTFSGALGGVPRLARDEIRGCSRSPARARLKVWLINTAGWWTLRNRRAHQAQIHARSRSRRAAANWTRRTAQGSNLRAKVPPKSTGSRQCAEPRRRGLIPPLRPQARKLAGMFRENRKDRKRGRGDKEPPAEGLTTTPGRRETGRALRDICAIPSGTTFVSTS